MIKKVVLLLGIMFTIMIGVGKASANTTTVKVEVVSRNIENHTINVKTDDQNADKFTLKKVSAAQMDIANKGSIIKVTYDDKFNLSAVEKVKSKAASKSKDNADIVIPFLGALCVAIIFWAIFACM